jgi:predicted porin
MTQFQLSKASIAVGTLLAGISLAAHAQSSVTLYGVVDEGLLYTSKTLNLKTGQDAGHQFSLISGGMTPSLFGLKGAEDLGGGVKAIFDLESGINVSNGGLTDSNGNLFGRQAWVGLSSNDYGTVKAGVQNSPFVQSLISTDARSVSYFGSGVAEYVGKVGVTGIFNSNAISYASPTIAGFQGNAMLALGGTAGNFRSGLEYSASLNYANGPFHLTAAMYDGNAGGTAASTPILSTVAFTGRTIGGTYHYGRLTLKAAYVNLKVANSFDDRVYGGGFDYRFTPALDMDAGLSYASDGNNTRNHSLLAATGLTYFLSRRTSIYGQFGYVDNHGAMDSGLSTNGALYAVAGSTFGAAVGIRHMF